MFMESFQKKDLGNMRGTTYEMLPYNPDVLWWHSVNKGYISDHIERDQDSVCVNVKQGGYQCSIISLSEIEWLELTDVKQDSLNGFLL